METFVLRVWMPAGREGGLSGDGPVTLQGVLEHIGSGRTLPFKGSDQLLDLVRNGLQETRQHRMATSQPARQG